MVELKHAPVPHHHVQAHGQQGGHKDNGRDVDIKLGNKHREGQKDEKKHPDTDCGPPSKQFFDQGIVPFFATRRI
jgi:hypothetical protein